MKKLTAQTLTILGFLGAITVAALWNSPAVIAAAIKAALVQNVDEPGRNPYQEGKDVSCGAIDFCDVFFSPVPAGKRLVVTSVSGTMFFAPGSSYRRADFRSNTRIYGQKLPLSFRGPADGADEYITNQTVLAYFEAGEIPVIDMGADQPFAADVNFAIAGYYITLP